MVRVKKIDHVALHVEDVEATGAFYTEVLGLARVPRPVGPNPNGVAVVTDLSSRAGTPGPTGGMWVQVGQSQIHMIQAERTEGRINPFGPHLALEVEDFDEAKDDLDQRGLTYVEAADGLPFRQLWLLDPSGNTVEIWAPRQRP